MVETDYIALHCSLTNSGEKDGRSEYLLLVTANEQYMQQNNPELSLESDLNFLKSLKKAERDNPICISYKS